MKLKNRYWNFHHPHFAVECYSAAGGSTAAGAEGDEGDEIDGERKDDNL